MERTLRHSMDELSRALENSGNYLTISETISFLTKEGFEVTHQQLRKYENAGLIIPAKKTDAKYRLYNDKNIEELRTILALRMINLPIKKIKKYIALNERTNEFIKAYCVRKKERLKGEYFDKRSGLTTKNPMTHKDLNLDINKFDLSNEDDRLKLRKVLLDLEDLHELTYECMLKLEKVENITRRFYDSFESCYSDADRIGHIIKEQLHQT